MSSTATPLPVTVCRRLRCSLRHRRHHVQRVRRGPEADKVTQPANTIIILAEGLGERFQPDFVAGHSLGEFSALVAAGDVQFADGLKLVSERALAMQAACEATPSTMAAILGMEDADVESVCNGMEGIVVAAGYNCPGQLVVVARCPPWKPRVRCSRKRAPAAPCCSRSAERSTLP